MQKIKSIVRKPLVLLVLGALFGVLVILGIRFATYKAPEKTHYHANFAVFINGERQKFTGYKYYEETSDMTCTLNKVESVKERAHMHDNVSDVVHVEDDLVSWGNFFDNLGWAVGDNYIRTDNTYYANGDQGKVTFILNGRKINSISGLTIGDKDKLLVSFGTDDNAALQNQYKAIASTAAKYDTSKDPASCGSNHKDATWKDRVRNLL